MQALRTLHIIGADQKISAAKLKAYDDFFTTPIPLAVLSAMAALVHREIPRDIGSPSMTMATPAGTALA